MPPFPMQDFFFLSSYVEIALPKIDHLVLHVITLCRSRDIFYNSVGCLYLLETTFLLLTLRLYTPVETIFGFFCFNIFHYFT
jgi:hypothetical protein